MMKAIAVILFVSLILPDVLFAAPSDAPQPSSSNESQQPPLSPKVDSDYSPRAKNWYLGTAIGTLVAGGAIVAGGIDESNNNDMLSDSGAAALYVIGGSFLATSAILWIFYFREKGKEPTASVDLELEKGKAVALVKYRF